MVDYRQASRWLAVLVLTQIVVGPIANFALLDSTLDGAGGFLILETDNPADLVTAASAFGPFYEFQITPVIDFAEAVPAVQKGMEYRNSV